MTWSMYNPRLNFSLKRSLLDLNHDLDMMKYRIESSYSYGFAHEHSHDLYSEELSNLQRMILLYEDRRFLSHSGIEWKSFLRMFKRAIFKWRWGGVSTIDQQLVRVLTRRYERSISRKIRECILALSINTHVSKRAIFYCYIHDAYYGYRLIGCEIASRFVFQIPAVDLSVEQSAFVACLLPLPLPKAVYKLIEQGEFGEDFDPEVLLDHPKISSTRWGKRIRYRYGLAKQNYDFIPKSLKIR